MRSFRKIVTGIVILLIFTAVVNRVSEFAYHSVNDNIVVTCKELKDSQGTLETLFVGNSLVHWGLDPRVMQEKLDSPSFNLATSAQPVSATYYVLKSNLRKNPVKRVFLGMSVQNLMREEDNTLTKTLAADLMAFPEKLEYMFKEADWDEYEQFLFYPTRVKNVLNFASIKKNIKYRLSEDYKNYIPYKKTSYSYYGKGFESREIEFDGKADEKIWKYGKWNESNISELHVSYIRKMAALCEKEGVEFNIVIFPHAQDFVRLQGDLSEMDTYMEELCEEINANLFNYNVTSYEGIYDLLPDEYFQDQKHFNTKGAAVFTELLANDYLERTGA